MDDVELEEETPVPAQKFHLVYTLPYILALFANIAYVWKVFFAGLSQLMDGHSNYVGNKDMFEMQAGAEIERLVKGEVDG